MKSLTLLLTTLFLFSVNLKTYSCICFFDAIVGFVAEVINSFKDLFNSSLILKDPIEALGVAWETVVNFFKAGINSLLTIFESFGKRNI